MSTERRPDPDELLARVKEAEARQARGKLKIFFGAAAGVGKTYAMLEAAREQRPRASTWSSATSRPTAAPRPRPCLGTSRSCPAGRVEYHGDHARRSSISTRALARRPALMLVDELAHTNAPGSRHAKRWQDVLELLDAGIDVYTTMNVQHVESLNDVVAQITGVIVRETVPDSIFEQRRRGRADRPAPRRPAPAAARGQGLRARAGARAVENFFRKGNLIALRELALRRDRRARRRRRCATTCATTRSTAPGRSRERLLVCVGPSPSSIRLVRAAKRMADGLGREWIVVYVETPAQTRLSQDARDRVAQTMRLAEQLGAETLTLTGARMSDEILAFARARNVTQDRGGQARAAAVEADRGGLDRGHARPGQRRDRRLRDQRRSRRAATAAASRVATADGVGALRRRPGRGRDRDRDRVGDVPVLRGLQPHHGLPARGDHRGHPLRPRAAPCSPRS